MSKQGNNFEVLHGRGLGGQYDAIALGDDDDDDGMDTDDMDSDTDADSDSDGGGDMMINVQEFKGAVGTRQVMFTEGEAVDVYRELWQTGFPLLGTRDGRYGPGGERAGQINDVQVQVEVETAQATTNGVGLQQYARLAFSTSDTTVQSDAHTVQAPVSANTAPRRQKNKAPPPYHPAQDYVFDFGAHKGKAFLDVPENYLRTIGGQAMVFDGRHEGLKEAFDYYRPGRRSTIHDDPPQFQEYQQPPPHFVAPRAATDSRWEDYQLPKGRWLGKTLDQVPEDYLRTMEGMIVCGKVAWKGLKDAMLDFNKRTGRDGKLRG